VEWRGDSKLVPKIRILFCLEKIEFLNSFREMHAIKESGPSCTLYSENEN
jgi:hypothetical protein